MNSKVKSTVKKEDIEQSALDQIEYIVSLDAVKSLAIMPDVHAGYTMPIGGVSLVDGHISPAFVGYDIGCGMCNYNMGELHGVDWQDVYNKIMQDIPVGVGRQNAIHIPEIPCSCDLFIPSAVATILSRSVKTSTESMQ